MPKSIKGFLLLALTAVFLTACSSSGAVTVKQAFLEPLQNEKTVSILIKSDKIKDQVEDVNYVIPTLRERLFARLVSENVFKGAVFAPNKADYSLEIDLTGMRIVSNTARVWGEGYVFEL